MMGLMFLQVAIVVCAVSLRVLPSVSPFRCSDLRTFVRGGFLAVKNALRVKTSRPRPDSSEARAVCSPVVAEAAYRGSGKPTQPNWALAGKQLLSSREIHVRI